MQPADPLCATTISDLTLGSRSIVPDNFSARSHCPHTRPTLPDTHELAAKECLLAGNVDIASFARNHSQPRPSRPERLGVRAARLLNDKKTHKYLPLVTRPWVIHVCQTDALCRFGVERTSRFFHSSRGFARNRTPAGGRSAVRNAQARKTLCQTFNWPTVSMSLSSAPGKY